MTDSLDDIAELMRANPAEFDEVEFGYSPFEWRERPAAPSDFDWRDHVDVSAPRKQLGQSCVSEAARNVLEILASQRGQTLRLDAACFHRCILGYPLSLPIMRVHHGLGDAREPGMPKTSAPPFDPAGICPVPLPPCQPYVEPVAITSISDAKSWIAFDGPLVGLMQATSSFLDGAFGTGVFKDDGSPVIGGHAVTIIGYDADADGEYWVCKNSFGPNWADRGYFKIAFNHGAMLTSTKYLPIGLSLPL